MEGYDAWGASIPPDGKPPPPSSAWSDGSVTQAPGTGLGDFLFGEATALDLNPLRDLSAQFDFLIRTSSALRHTIFKVFVIRLRAAYLGAFNRFSESPNDPNESELTVSLGLSW